MHVLQRETAPRYTRPEGITSYLLASLRTSNARYLTSTLVEIQPGGEQRLHSHIPEQVYFILEGRGLMTVGSETKQIGPGDCVFIPSEQPHGLRNDGETVLRYFSAAAPAFEREALESYWPLKSEAETGKSSIGEDQEGVLRFLDNLLYHEQVRAFLDGVVQRIEQRLQNDPAAVMAWEPVPLDLYGTPLPGSIQSSWVFILRANVATGAERHPNSRQRMMSYRALGDLQTKTKEHWDSNPLKSDPKAPLNQRWISIPENVWHRAVTPDANWVVVSFHTVPAKELIEERPDANQPGSMQQKKYLE